MTPPRASANRILIWMCVLIAINQLVFGAVVLVIALYARSFGVTQSAIGLAIAIYGPARFLVALPAAQLGDRLGRRTALAAAGLVTAAGNLRCAYAPSYGDVLFVLAPSCGWFLVGCVAGSAAAGVSGAAPATYAADVAPVGMNAAAISGYRMLSDLGDVIGPIALGAAADLFGADATRGVTALLLVVVSLVFWRLAPESFRPSGI